MSKGGLDTPTVAAIAVLLVWGARTLLGGFRAVHVRHTEASAAEGKVAPLSTALAHAVGLQSVAMEADVQASSAVIRGAVQRVIGYRVPLSRRTGHVPRKGWKDSPLYQALTTYDDTEFRRRFRVSRGVFEMIVQRVRSAGHVVDNKCQNPWYRTPAWFKVGATLLHLAQGGTWWQTGFCAGVSEATILRWVVQTCKGICETLRDDYMRKPTPQECIRVQERFATRRGLLNIGGAVNGTHVPWAPESEDYMEQFHNYKGWYSILVVAVVNSFYMFVDAEVGRPGRMSDSTATQLSHFFNDMMRDSESWLGPHGMLLSDGACSNSDFILTPYPGTKLTNMQQWFNFCLSSTRMFVEQVFGQWKNRWRVLLREQQCRHGTIRERENTYICKSILRTSETLGPTYSPRGSPRFFFFVPAA